jgi:hypothetical protein
MREAGVPFGLGIDKAKVSLGCQSRSPLDCTRHCTQGPAFRRGFAGLAVFLSL